METTDIIFQLKKGVSTDQFDERFHDFIEIYEQLHDIKDPVEKYKIKHSQSSDELSDKQIFEDKIYREMPELEKKLYRTYIIKELSEDESQKVYNKLEGDSKQGDAIIEYVQHSFFYETTYSSNLTQDNISWGINHLQCSEAWQFSGLQGDDVVVAVIDSGVDYTHDYLNNHMWIKPGTRDIYGHNFVNEAQPPVDNMNDGHGTHCAGIIAATYNVKVKVSVAPKAKIMAVKIFEKTQGTNLYKAPTPLCAKAIVFAADNGAKILSNSWELAARTTEIDNALRDAINHASDVKNCIVVFSAGNKGVCIDNTFPANHKKVISVAAINGDDRRTINSNWGKTITISAPGIQIISLKAGSVSKFVTKLQDGTSMACPHVAGLIALLLSIKKGLSFEQIKNLLCNFGLALPVPQDNMPLGSGKGAHALSSVKALIGGFY